MSKASEELLALATDAAWIAWAKAKDLALETQRADIAAIKAKHEAWTEYQAALKKEQQT